jgi:ATP-dependent Clp protease ATP-binding subunit ClpA
LVVGLFPLGLLLLAIRAVMILRERKRRRDASAVIDFARLRRTDLGPRVAEIKNALRGHDAAVDRIVARTQENLELAAPGRTLGAFMLVGPTGTGKTYLAELFSQALYPAGRPLTLRMNQFKDHQDVSTLLGPPPGYAGYEIGGALTRPVIRDPYRVVILDEFEKAHPDVRHCFYDILDTGQCSEKSSGQTAHFGACLFFATCNAGYETLRAIFSEPATPARRLGRARDALAGYGFDKALLARFDDVLLLDMLPSFVVAEIACLQIAKYWRQYGIDATYASPELLAETVRRNTGLQDYGVRELARQIQEHTSPAIHEARRAGARRVRLSVDPSAERILVEEA